MKISAYSLQLLNSGVVVVRASQKPGSRSKAVSLNVSRHEGEPSALDEINDPESNAPFFFTEKLYQQDKFRHVGTTPGGKHIFVLKNDARWKRITGLNVRQLRLYMRFWTIRAVKQKLLGKNTRYATRVVILLTNLMESKSNASDPNRSSYQLSD